MIQVDQLSKSFRGDAKKGASQVMAVSEVSFTAADGQITGLLGPNGAGKTTLLRMLATVLSPDAGTATIDGHDVLRERDQVRRSIGVLADAKGLYPRLTARENIRYYGELHGLHGGDLERRIDQLLHELGIASLGDRRTQGFSQGERMKVAIARTLVHAPQTIVLDEPTNGLDVISVRGLRDQLRRWRDAGKCVLFSSHVMQEVAALCDRIVIIGRGRVLAAGTPADILAASGEQHLEEAFIHLLVNADAVPA